MIEVIKTLNRNNKDDFIKQYGLINNVDVAKELLCITSNAWFVLDESLKSNSEIIMYYQPMAILEYDVEEDMGGVFETTIYGTIPQEGFKLTDRRIQIPNIKFPSDFDVDDYIVIQNKLFEKYEKYYNHDVFYRNEEDMGNIMKNIEFVETKVERTVPHFKYQETPRANTTYKVYDRTRLKEIINNVLCEDVNSLQSNGKHK